MLEGFKCNANGHYVFILGPIEDGDETVYHAYYQWVPLMLMFQAICFYAPHWIWKQLDNGRMKVRYSSPPFLMVKINIHYRYLIFFHVFFSIIEYHCWIE